MVWTWLQRQKDAEVGATRSFMDEEDLKLVGERVEDAEDQTK